MEICLLIIYKKPLYAFNMSRTERSGEKNPLKFLIPPLLNEGLWSSVLVKNLEKCSRHILPYLKFLRKQSSSDFPRPMRVKNKQTKPTVLYQNKSFFALLQILHEFLRYQFSKQMHYLFSKDPLDLFCFTDFVHFRAISIFFILIQTSLTRLYRCTFIFLEGKDFVIHSKIEPTILLQSFCVLWGFLFL